MNNQDYLVIALMICYILLMIYIWFHPTNKSSSSDTLKPVKADNKNKKWFINFRSGLYEAKTFITGDSFIVFNFQNGHFI